MKHSSVAIGTAQEILLLCGVGIISRDIIHMCPVSVDLSTDRAGAATN